jgi:hypothetical protein
MQAGELMVEIVICIWQEGADALRRPKVAHWTRAGTTKSFQPSDREYDIEADEMSQNRM